MNNIIISVYYYAEENFSSADFAAALGPAQKNVEKKGSPQRLERSCIGRQNRKAG
jgi:hypothetical protein